MTPPDSTNSPVAGRWLSPLNIPDEEIDRILDECVAAINGQIPPPDGLLLTPTKFLRLTAKQATAILEGQHSPPARKPRKPSLSSVAKAASKAAIPVARYEVKPDGTVVVVTGMPTANNTDANPWDEVLINAADQKRPS